MSAEDRRESVIHAAISEFAQNGYHGTSTEAIAKRVGVSQPYLFRLFPGKKAIFLAATDRCMRDMRRMFEEAAEGLEGEAAHEAMGEAYARLVSERPERLRLQLQTFLAVAVAEAEGDHEFGEKVRKDWMEIWDTVHVPLGADVDETTSFVAYGMLINTLTAMGFPPGHRVWNGFETAPRAQGEGVGPAGGA